ncbi:MAG: phosphoribosyl-AMP cyclohydrolase [Candidatus Omnitrophica bacterium]|nr:phosphoribosyl-AMP cyclohydrolase [Candidatus Omnitrophota bacterium]
MTQFKFDANGLIAAIIQDADSGEVLMLAYMDKIALERTMKEKHTVFYSRSRKQYWVKGETSGHKQDVTQMLTDCDQDAVLIKVRQKGGACHLGYRTCFVHELNDKGDIVRITQEKVFDPDKVYKT